jgi:HPt (histidine-containing phosphotransfer) domain-containing protein
MLVAMITEMIQKFKAKLHSQLNNKDNRAKIQCSDFIIALLHAISKANSNFSLADLWRSVNVFLEIKICRSSFNERLNTPKLAKSLEQALQTLMTMTTRLFREEIDSKLLANIGVNNIIGVDASLVTLWDGLSKYFKGTFTNASLKLHFAINLINGEMIWFNTTKGAVHDSQQFPNITSKILYIFDLGYWSVNLLDKIRKNNAFYLTRLKANSKFIVIEVIYGVRKSIIGHDLLRFEINKFKKKIIEVFATTTVNGVVVQTRIVGFWHKKEKRYRFYTTNLTCSRSVIYDLYRLRWQIELSFKAMKSTLNFDRMPTLNENAVLTFTFIALINYIFAILMRKEAIALAKDNKELDPSTTSIQRAVNSFRAGAGTLLKYLLLGKRLTVKGSNKLYKTILPLIKDIFDPNRKRRKTTLGRAEYAS